MIANHLWQSTLFTVVVALLCYILRNEGAHIRYWLWWTASIKFLVPFSLLAAIGRSLAGKSVIYIPDSWSIAVERIAQPLPVPTSLSTLTIGLLAIWALGSIALALRWFMRARRLRTTVGKAKRESAPIFYGHKKIDVYRSAEPIEPGIVGIFSPVLLLPQGIVERLTTAQLEAVIAHEICHVERADNLTAAVHMIVETIFWFFPPIWWIGTRLIKEREFACDEAVVRVGHDRQTYAESILNVCEHYLTFPLRCTAGVSGADLKARIRHIMRNRTMTKLGLPKKLLLATASVTMLATPIITGFLMQSMAMAQQEDELWLPVVKVAPIYPERAAERGLDGYVIVEYTVTENGGVEDAVVIESSSNLFDDAALSAIRKYKYAPRVEDGRPIAVPGMRMKIEFVLEQ